MVYGNVTNFEAALRLEESFTNRNMPLNGSLIANRNTP